MTAESAAGHPELAGLHQWVCYRIESGPDGKSTKKPYSPQTGRLADTTNPGTWDAHATAVAAVPQHGFQGTGFVFFDEDPFTGIDLDNCRDVTTGDIAPWAQRIISSFNSYSEISPSGTGVHVFVRGKLPRGARCSRKYFTGKVEIYSRERFFTFTGDHLSTTPMSIELRQMQLC